MTKYVNRHHNPFKTIIKKLKSFLESNKITIPELLSRINPLNESVDLSSFAKFLKEKIEKEEDLENLLHYT